MSHDDGEGENPNPFAPRAAPSAPNPFGGAASGNPFGAPASAPNPFQTPPAAAPNPFDAVMGQAPAAPPKPEQDDDEEQGSPITLLPPMKPDGAPPPGRSDDAMEALGLELAEPPPPAPTPKKSRPELQEWGAEFPVSNSGEPGEKPDLAAVSRTSSPRMAALPPPKKSRTWVLAVLGLLALAIGGGVAKKAFDLKASEDRRKAARADDVSSTDKLLELGIRPDNAPDCWVRDQGFTFRYRNSAGEEVSVASIEDIPVLYRSGASCSPL